MAHFSRRTFLGAASLWAATTSAATRIAVPGESIKPIIDVDSLILRRVERLGPLAWNVIDWEASLYRPIGEDRYLTAGETVVNPHTGRAIEPLHYIEGPVRWCFTDQEPRIFGSRDPLPRTGKPFGYPWRIVAGDIWMTKSSYIEAPHWLQPGDWPLESSGEKLIVATHSSLRSSLTDVQDSRVDSAPTDFAYSATSSWLPWMLMGQTPFARRSASGPDRDDPPCTPAVVQASRALAGVHEHVHAVQGGTEAASIDRLKEARCRAP